MKKCDLIVLGLYVAVLVFIMGYFTAVTYQERREKVKAMDYIKELYKKPVRTVLVEENLSNITIEPETSTLPKLNGFKLAGGMFADEINCLKIQGDTLVITGKMSQFSHLTLHLEADVKLDTIVNMPNVKR